MRIHKYRKRLFKKSHNGFTGRVTPKTTMRLHKYYKRIFEKSHNYVTERVSRETYVWKHMYHTSIVEKISKWHPYVRLTIHTREKSSDLRKTYRKISLWSNRASLTKVPHEKSKRSPWDFSKNLAVISQSDSHKRPPWENKVITVIHFKKSHNDFTERDSQKYAVRKHNHRCETFKEIPFWGLESAFLFPFLSSSNPFSISG